MQPYYKESLDPKKMIPLPWDRESGESKPEMTREERKARYEAAKKRYGIE